METEHTYLWQTYTDVIGKACDAADLDSAATVLDYALSEAEELGELDHRVVKTTHNLSSRLCQAEKLNLAESINKHLLEVREKLLGTDHPDVIDSLERLAYMQTKAREAYPRMLAAAGR